MHQDTHGSAVTDRPALGRSTALWLLVPLTTLPLGALGLVQAGRLRASGAQDDPTLAVAMVAAATCLAIAGWWLGGLALWLLAACARRLRWTALETWATRLTPGLVARTAAAVVGVQLAVVAPAHAADAALDPFWAPAASGTEQLADPGADPVGSTGTGGGSTAGEVPAPLLPDTAAPSPGLPEQAAVPAPSDATQQAGAATSSPERTHGAEVNRAETGGDTTGTVAPGTAAETARTLPSARERVADGTVTVVAGDTLWDLTAQLLGPGASDCDISQALDSWLQENTLAEHGDLIHPGDQLRVPPRLLNPESAPG